MPAAYKTPGVYIVEKKAFPNSIVAVPTAVPAFVGYTSIADNKGRPLWNKPFRISSMAEFNTYFGDPPTPKFTISAIDNPNSGPETDFIKDDTHYYLKQTDGKFNLYYAMMQFFQNYGGPCYIVAVGNYDNPPDYDKLKAGIDALENEQEPTMLVIPDAVLLDFDICIKLQQQMLRHCGDVMRNRFALLDIYDGYKNLQDPDGSPIAAFRDHLGINNLDYGAAYYPWLNTTIVEDRDLSYANIDNLNLLVSLLTPKSDDPSLPIWNTPAIVVSSATTTDGAATSTTAGGETTSGTVAGGSETTAGGAESTPGGAETTAGGAETTAGGAESTPGGAETTAGGAETTAGGAESTPGGAETTAGGAESTPGGAETTAGGAETTAGGAESTPGGAETTAGGAETTAGGAGTTIAASDGGAATITAPGTAGGAGTAASTDGVTTPPAVATKPAPVAAVSKVTMANFVTNPPANATKAQITQVNQALVAVSELFGVIMKSAARRLNLLPPSSAMAGLYTFVDNSRGVWKAPANVSVNSVVSPAVNLSAPDQEDLNVTPTGKSINAIRSFIGEGVLVWGARTLDGNSLDWRYVNVRRTMIFLEESCRLAAKAMVFEPNVAGTWLTIRSMIENFLTSIWRQGGLAGATPEDAFSVHVGLGDTMTADDILEGMLRVTVLVAISHPAEFIEITFQQQMQKS